MKKLTVKTSKKYDITICGDFSCFYEKVKPLIKGDKAAVLFDENTFALYKDYIDGDALGVKLYHHVICSGEKSKNAVNYMALINKLAEWEFTRKDALITFGGGVVGDLGAFAASTYMRGITLIALPTTLLSMVDSSVGGKTGIDLEKGKNLCGTFYQPSAVYINLGFLETLPEKEFRCGLGEILKYRYLSKKQEDINADIIDETLIYNCLKIKAKIVGKDETESNLRKLLNFGHTFGHAIEKASDYTVSHGECVAKGILFALKISSEYFGYGDELIKEYKSTAKKYGLDIACEYPVKELIEIAKSDKKRVGGGIDFVLVDKSGKPKIVNIPLDELSRFDI